MVTHIYTMSHDDGYYKQFSSSNSLLFISCFNSFGCSAFSLAAHHIQFASATSVSSCNFSACSERSSAAADRASASVSSAFLFMLSYLITQSFPFLTCNNLFLFQLRCIFYRALTQYSSSCLLLTSKLLTPPTK